MRVLLGILVLVGFSSMRVAATPVKPPAHQAYSHTSKTVSAPARGLFTPIVQTLPPITVPVNAFLWRAALKTISFMPLHQVDPFSGVIITEWTPVSPKERFKLTVYVLSPVLRVEGLKVSVFRQTFDAVAGTWKKASVAPEVPRKLENVILRRAQALRVFSHR